jgi:hypothetical protein
MATFSRSASALVADLAIEERRRSAAALAAPVVHALVARCFRLLDVLLDESHRDTVERAIVALGSAADRGIEIEAGVAASYSRLLAEIAATLPVTLSEHVVSTCFDCGAQEHTYRATWADGSHVLRAKPCACGPCASAPCEVCQ